MQWRNSGCVRCMVKYGGCQLVNNCRQRSGQQSTISVDIAGMLMYGGVQLTWKLMWH
jgi:hypothetical protein